MEGEVLEHALAGVLELGAIGLFDGVQGLIDSLAIAGLVAVLVQGVEAGTGRQYKALALHHLLDQLRLIAVGFHIFLVVVLLHIGDVLEEQHGEDKVFVGIGTDGAAKGIAGIPQGFVDAVLADLFGGAIAAHGVFVVLCVLLGAGARSNSVGAEIVMPGVARWRLLYARRWAATAWQYAAGGRAVNVRCGNLSLTWHRAFQLFPWIAPGTCWLHGLLAMLIQRQGGVKGIFVWWATTSKQTILWPLLPGGA